MTLKEALKNDIKILSYDLKDEDELKAILKKRLTKKEFKLYTMKNDGFNTKYICTDLKLDLKRYEEIKTTIYKKLNYEKLKNELSEK